MLCMWFSCIVVVMLVKSLIKYCCILHCICRCLSTGQWDYLNDRLSFVKDNFSPKRTFAEVVELSVNFLLLSI